MDPKDQTATPDEPADTSPDTTPAAVETGTTPDEPVDRATAALEALDAGIAGDELPADKKPAAKDAKPEAKPAKESKDEPANPDPKATKPDASEDAEAEIVSLGLKARAAERFRGLTGELKAHKDAMEAAGVKSLDELPTVLAKAKNGDDLIAMVQETGATPDQYGAALDYLRDVNAAAKGDRAAAERAYNSMSNELTALAKALGKEAPGVDPLEGHDDLAEAVAAGDMTPKYAKEIAEARASKRLAESAQQRQQQDQQGTAAQQQAVAQIAALDKQFAESDPAYAAKRPILDKMVRQFRSYLPPEKWAEATASAYASLANMQAAPAQAPAPAKKPVGPVPMRPTGSRPTLAPTTLDPMEAMNLGIASVGQ